MGLLAVAPLIAHAQGVGLGEDSFSSLNVTASYVLAQDFNSTGWVDPGGLNPTISHNWDSGLQTFNTATGRVQYSDQVQFGGIQINTNSDIVSGTAPGVYFNNPSQDLYSGISTNYDTYPTYICAFEDTFTATTNMTLDFEMLAGFSSTGIHSAQGTDNSYVGTTLTGEIDGNGATKESTGAFQTSSGWKNGTISFILTAGQTVDINMVSNLDSFAGTYYAQYQQEDKAITAVNDQLLVYSTTGGTYTTGSGHIYAVPEPAEWLPLLLGIGVLALKTRR